MGRMITLRSDYRGYRVRSVTFSNGIAVVSAEQLAELETVKGFGTEFWVEKKTATPAATPTETPTPAATPKTSKRRSKKGATPKTSKRTSKKTASKKASGRRTAAKK